MVFQNYALFPHMSVAETVAYPLQVEIHKPHCDLGATFIYGMKWMRSMVKIANGGCPILPAGA
jgi:ABC-type Fe3+/spermidine/putrescine transport system ATPase subunit